MQLVQYEQACNALQICATVDEAKDILDKVSSLQAYAKQTNNNEMEAWLSWIKLRARRRIGEITRELEKAPRGGSGGTSKNPSGGKKETLKQAGLSTSVANRCEKVAEIDESEFEAVIREAKDKGKPITYADVEKKVSANRKAAKKEEKKEAKKVIDGEVGNYRLINSDFRKISVSADCIITDPPYPKEYIHIYEDLAKFAKESLRQGGLLIVMTGQSYLPEILSSMAKHIDYLWTAAYLTPGGQSVQVFPRKVNTFWKPLLIFSNGEYRGDWFGDVCKSKVNDNDKTHHHWGQSESGMADIVERFSYPKETILDPFCGAGTTGVVATQLNRNFIGIDIDKPCIEKSTERLQCQK